MKFFSLLLLGCLATGHAAVYTMNLGAAPDQSPADNVDGWVQSEANYVDVESGEAYPRAFIHSIGASSALALGGYYDSFPAENGPEISISRELALVGINYSTLSLDFTIQDSITTYSDGVEADVDRNQFSIGFFGAEGRELINLIFRPNSQSSDPSASTAATWNMYVSSGGNPIGDAFGAVIEGSPNLGGVYTLSLVTVPSATAGAVDFNLSVSSSVNTMGRTGTLQGLAGENIEALKVGWMESGEEIDGLGSNFIALNQVVVGVPEPSGFLLCIASVLPIALRRRRTRA